MDAETLLTTTRTVRRRLDLTRPVPRADVLACVATALQAPAGSNRRTYRFVVVDDPEQRAALGTLYRKGYDIYGTKPNAVTAESAGDARDPATRVRIVDSVRYLAEHIHEVPCLVLPVIEGRSIATNQSGYWGSVYPAVWSFMLAARARGLGTALTTMHLAYEREAAELLGIPYDDFTQVAMIPVAYTIGDDFRTIHIGQPDEYVSWNRW